MTQALAPLHDQLVVVPNTGTDRRTVAVVGLGYVGLPTSLALQGVGTSVVGIDVSERRLSAIRDGRVDLALPDLVRLGDALRAERLRLTDDMGALSAVDAILICVPTPVDADRVPDTSALRTACAAVVAHAARGQTIVLTSTTYVGTTRELLVEPLEARGLTAGHDVFVAFAPERINPGDRPDEQRGIPRVVAGATPECADAAISVLGLIADELHRVSSLEAGELSKLYENTFRAVNLALANEMAGIAGHYGLDPVELVDAAATKPYGFLAHYPGAGVGGHCIPVDPHYLLSPLQAQGVETPLVARALAEIVRRPELVAERALATLRNIRGSRVLVVGLAYKPRVADTRESPARAIGARLAAEGVSVAYHDPLVPADGELVTVAEPRPDDYDLVVIATVHPGHDYEWLHECDHVLDATYRTPCGRHRHWV